MKNGGLVARISRIVILFSFMLGLGMGGAEITHGNAIPASGEPWMQNKMIAHAMGSVDGKTYTNSYEAFMANYNRGYRLFEVDLSMTSDGKLAARHDWREKIQPDLPVESGRVPTLSQFKQALIDGAYRPLSWADVVSLMAKYPDVYVITDMKETDLRKIKDQFEALVADANAVDPAVLQRVIPELFDPEMFEAVMDIYPFPHKLYSLYRTRASVNSVVAFAKAKHITAVAMPVSRTILHPTLIPRLNKLGVKSYVHTVNSTAVMKGLQDAGAYGFYTEAARSPDELLAAAKKRDVGEAGSPLLYILLFCGGIQWIYNDLAKQSKNRLKVRTHADK